MTNILQLSPKKNSQQSDHLFDNFDMPNIKQSQNIEDLMEKVQKQSFDWDNFDAPPHNPSSKQQDHSAMSDIFNRSKKSTGKSPLPPNIEDSRNVMDISVNCESTNQQSSFHFEKQNTNKQPKNSQRYVKLQQFLNKKQTNNMDQFYKNMEQEQVVYQQQPEKFNNYTEFKDYVKSLKSKKKQKEIQVAERQIENPFQSTNSNKMEQFGFGNFQFQGLKYGGEEHQKPTSQYNFVKKPQSDKYVPFNKPLSRKQSEENVMKNSADDQFQLFDSSKKPKEPKFQLQPQPQTQTQPMKQSHHSSSPPHPKILQQQKLSILFTNYKTMRKNYQQLMSQLKSTNKDQIEIISQLKKLKSKKKENDELYNSQKQKNQKKQLLKNDKNQQFNIIKNQIIKLKIEDKDILFNQINKKIQQLQSVVKSALQQINQDKSVNFVPKVTNYFCQHQHRFQNIDQQFQSGFSHSHQQNQSHQQQSHNQSHEQSRQLFTQNIEGALPKSQIQNQSKKSEKNSSRAVADRSNKQLSSHKHDNEQHQQRYSQHLPRVTNINSPLDLHFQNNYPCDDSEQDSTDQQFIPQQFSKNYQPFQYQQYTRNLRTLFLQKNSTVYENFDFCVGMKFSMVDDDPIYIAMAEIKIINKCSISLYDVHVIVYGIQGPSIVTDPSTIFQEEVKKNSGFVFRISIDKVCLAENCINVQISHRNDSLSKKKTSFRIPLPLIQLICPEFVYAEKFVKSWSVLQNQLYLKPKKLDTAYFRSHQDLKLLLPFIQLPQQHPNQTAYGLIFHYPKYDNVFYLRIGYYFTGRASVQLRSQNYGDKKLKQEILNVLNYVLFGQL